MGVVADDLAPGAREGEGTRVDSQRDRRWRRSAPSVVFGSGY